MMIRAETIKDAFDKARIYLDMEREEKAKMRRLYLWRGVLKDILTEYPGHRSLPNVLENIEQRLKYYESKRNEKNS